MIIQDKLGYRSPKWPQLSNQAKDLVTRLLEKNPKKRLSLEEALAHEWFSMDLA